MNYTNKIYLIISKFVTSQYFFVLVAFFVGLVSIFPYYSAQYSLGDGYKGMPLLYQDSEGEYLGRVHEIVEGHYSVASPVFYEYKNGPSVVPATGEWIYAIPSKLLSVSVVGVDMFFKFLFPTILFILVYMLLMSLVSCSVFWANVGALLVTLGFDFPSVYFIKKVLFSGIFTYISPWTRPVNPIVGMIFLCIYLFVIYRIYTNKISSKYYVLSGLLLSVMVGYFFSFVYAGVLTCLFIVWSWFSKDRQVTYKIFFVLFVGFVGTAILFGPSIISLVSGKFIGGVSDPRLQGLFYTRMPLINKTSLLFSFIFILFSCFVYYFKKQKVWLEDWWVFSAIILLTNQIVFNIQIVLGWTIWPQHFSQYTNTMLNLVAVIFLSQGLAKLNSKFSRFIGWGIVFMIVLLLSKTLPLSNDTVYALTDFQKERTVFDWINKNTSSDCVVYVVQDDTVTLELNRFMAAYTNCDVYNSYHVYQSVPRERVFHNLMVWLWMKGVTETELPKFLDTENLWIRSYLFRDWRDIFCCDGDAWVASLGSREEWENWYSGEKKIVEGSYGDFIKKDIDKELNKYRLDYVVVDRNGRVRSDLNKQKWLKIVYEDERYQIYQFI